MVIAPKRGLDDVEVEPIHGQARVVDDKVDAIGVLLLDEGGKRLDAGGLGDVQLMKLDVGQAALGAEGFGVLEGCVLGRDGGDGVFASRGVASGEINKERAGVERGFGVSKGELADCGKGGLRFGLLIK